MMFLLLSRHSLSLTLNFQRLCRPCVDAVRRVVGLVVHYKLCVSWSHQPAPPVYLSVSLSVTRLNLSPGLLS